MLRGSPLEWNVFSLYKRYCESSISLEYDCGMDSVRRYLFLTPLQEGTHHKLLAQGKI